MRSCLAALVLLILAPSLGYAQDVDAGDADVAAEAEATDAPSASADASATAAESAGLDDAGRLVYQAAVDAFEAGRYDEALERFQTAHRLSGRDRLHYNIALCFDRLDRKAEALEEYELFLAAVPNDAMASRASARVAFLRPAVEAERAEAERAEAERLAEEGSREQSDVPPSRSLAGPIALLGVGAAGLITWGTAGLIARSRFNDAESSCGGGCDEETKSGISTPALVADIGLVVGIAAAAGGLIWLLVGGGSDASETALRLEPMGSLAGGGLQASGSF